MAKIITASGRGVAERWLSQYRNKCDGRWPRIVSGSAEEIYNRLLDLGDTPSIKEVADVIGNKSWSYISCDGCGEYVEVAVEIGVEGETYCRNCIAGAHEAFAMVSRHQVADGDF